MVCIAIAYLLDLGAHVYEEIHSETHTCTVYIIDIRISTVIKTHKGYLKGIRLELI